MSSEQYSEPSSLHLLICRFADFLDSQITSLSFENNRIHLTILKKSLKVVQVHMFLHICAHVCRCVYLCSRSVCSFTDVCVGVCEYMHGKFESVTLRKTRIWQ